jgi:hypothetical protein
MGVAAGGDPRTDIQELPDPGLADQAAHRPAQERPVSAHAEQNARLCVGNLLPGGPVGPEIILIAQPVVIPPALDAPPSYRSL